MELVEDPEYREALDWDQQSPSDEEKPMMLWSVKVPELTECKEIA